VRSKLQELRSYLPINRNYAESLLTGYGLMAITIVIQLVLIPLYITHLGKAQFGVLVMIMAANNYAAIGITWLSGGMARILAGRAAVDDREGFRAAYAFSKSVFVLYALGAISMFWLVAPWLIGDALADREILVAIILSCVYFILAYEYNADRQAFIARHWQARGNLREAGGQIVFAGVVGIGLYSGMGLPGVVLAQIAGILFTRFLAWRHWKNDGYGLEWTWPVPGVRDLWRRVSSRVGRDYVLYGILLLTLQADVLLVGWLAGSETAATYYLLWRIPEVCILLLWRIPSSYAPHLIAMEARGEHDELSSNYRKGLTAIIVLAGVGAVFYGVAGNWFVHLWVGASAPEGYIPYLIAAVAMFFTAVSKWPADVAYALANTRPLVKIAALEVGTKLFLLILLFGAFGYLSPLLAVILAHTLGVFYLYLWLGKNTCNIPRLGSNHHISQ
jgi:O-antigen/teichoic acid export membrane protein